MKTLISNDLYRVKNELYILNGLTKTKIDYRLKARQIELLLKEKLLWNVSRILLQTLRTKLTHFARIEIF